MKLKATISLPGEDFSPDQRLSLATLIGVTNGLELNNRVLEEALIPHLRVAETIGPAEKYTQLTDRTTRPVNYVVGVDVTLSGVSVTLNRSIRNFWDALKALHLIYREVAIQHLSVGLKAQVFTRMALDAQIKYLENQGSTTSLPEHDPEIVEGTSLIKADSMAQVVRAELVALLGDERTLNDFLTIIREGKIDELQGSNPERIG